MSESRLFNDGMKAIHDAILSRFRQLLRDHTKQDWFPTRFLLLAFSAFAWLSLSVPAAHAACMDTLDFSSGGVGSELTLEVSSCDQGVRSGLFLTSGVDTNFNLPMNAHWEDPPNAATLTSSNGAEILITPGPFIDLPSPGGEVIDTYTVELTALGTTPSGTVTLHYASESCPVTGDCTPMYATTDTPLTLNVLHAVAPVITSQPSNTTVDVGGSTSFSVSADNATSYQWQVNTGSGFTNISDGSVYSGATSATLTITGATIDMDGNQYQAIASGDEPPPATSDTATLAVNPVVPGPPLDVHADAGDGEVIVGFLPPADDGGAPITQYTVTSNPGSFIVNDITSPIVVTGLTNGTSYTFTVTATNSAGMSPASVASNAVTPTAPAPTITNIDPAIGPEAGGTSVTITGANLNGASTVTFGGAAATGVSVNGAGTEITAVTPAGSGTVDVVVTTPGGSVTATGGFAYQAPATAVVTVVSVPGNGNYGMGAVLNFGVQFDQDVEVTGTPYLSLTVGSENRQALYTAGSGTSTLAFSYTVQAGDLDTDGIELGGSIALNGGSIQNMGTSIDVNPALNGVPSTSGILVDGIAPVVVSTAVIGTPAPGATTAEFAVTFSEPVTGLVQSDFDLTTTGSAVGTVASLSGSGANYIVTVSAVSGEGMLRLDVGTIGATSIEDLVGNPFSGFFASGTPWTVVSFSSSDATLSALVLSAGTLDPAFASGTTSYTATVQNATDTITVTPTAADANATITVNGTAVASGDPSGAISLNVGANPISIEVTAQDGATTEAYEVAVTREAPITLILSPSGGALPEAMAGEDYSASITTSGGVGSILYRVASGTLPDGMILNFSTGELTGPLSPDTEGDYAFTIEAEDGDGNIGTAAYTLTVAERAVTVSDHVVDVKEGSASPNVDLTAGATGGPFVDGDIVSVVPSNAGTAEIVHSQYAQAGSGTPLSFYLKFTPNPGFSGQAVVRFQLTSALGLSNVGSVTYNLSYDPAALAQEMHRDVRSFVQARMNLISSTISVPSLLNRRSIGTEPVTSSLRPTSSGLVLAFASSLAQMNAASNAIDGIAASEALPSPFNIWIDGTAIVHNRTDNGSRWGTFGLLSGGMDYLLTDQALVGLSFHIDHMRDPIDENTTLTGSGWLAGPYASFEIGEGLFFDTKFLYGGSNNTIDTAFFDGDFDTRRWLWDASISGRLLIDETTTLTPRLRALYLNETVLAHEVSNDAGDVLGLPGFTQQQFRVSIGAEIERRFVLENGLVLTPNLGVTGGVSGLDGSGAFGSLTTGFSLTDEELWTIDAGLRLDIDGNGQTAAGARIGLGVRF